MINMDYFKRALVLKMLEFFASRHFWFEFNAFLYRRREREKDIFCWWVRYDYFFKKDDRKYVWPSLQSDLKKISLMWSKNYVLSNILNTTFSLYLKKWLLVGTRHFHRKIDVLFDQYSTFLKDSMTFVYWLEGL